MKKWPILVAIALVVVGGSIAILRHWYSDNLKPVSSSTATAYFTVSQGSGVHQIAVDLQAAGLIRSISAFETYVTANNDRNKLQAGTYEFSPSMSAQTVVNKMVRGDIAKDLLTILPAKRLDQIEQAFRKMGYSQTEISAAFNPAAYAGHPALASLPAGASLEGYLYPDSFQKLSDTPAQFIVRESLDEMQSHLTNDIVNGFAAQGLNAFAGITLASIVGLETDNPAYQPMVAQVFLLRLKQNKPLESNVTAYYAADIAHVPRSISIDSPYNTYLHPGLPPGPISNVTASALKAVAHPANTSYLYFITGDDGKMYFSYTLQEHQQAIAEHCKKGCSQ